jgi:hypothetical protein
MNEELKYPWQSPVFEALVELNPSQLPQKIAVADAAIAKRLREFDCATNLSERIALDDAHRSLTALKVIQD